MNTKNTYNELDFPTTLEKIPYPYDIIQNSIPIPSKILHIKLCNERRKELVNFLLEIIEDKSKITHYSIHGKLQISCINLLANYFEELLKQENNKKSDRKKLNISSEERRVGKECLRLC